MKWRPGAEQGILRSGVAWVARASTTSGAAGPQHLRESTGSVRPREDGLGYSPSSDRSSQDAGAERRRVIPGPPREPPSTGLLGGGVQRGPRGTRERRGRSAPPRLGAGTGVPGSPAAAATPPPAPASYSLAGGSAPPAHSPSGLQGNRGSSATPGGHQRNTQNHNSRGSGHLLWFRELGKDR